jgi:hypothetical protein
MPWPISLVASHPWVTAWIALHLVSTAYVLLLIVQSDREFATEQSMDSSPADMPEPRRISVETAPRRIAPAAVARMARAALVLEVAA